MQNDEIVYLYLDDVIPNRFQPREVFDDEALKELAISIKEHGVIQPIIVRQVNNKYEIIAGERRYKASTMAGLTKIPAIIKNLDDKESSKVALIENLQRRDLTPIEEARTYQKILDLEGNMTQDQLAQTMGKTQSAVSNKLRLLSLPEEIQQALLNEQISERHARCLLNLSDKNQQVKLLEKIILSRMTVKELEKEIKMLKEQETLGSFDMTINGDTVSENNDVPPYTSSFGRADVNPTAVDINKIRENSFDIMPEEKKSPNINDLMRPGEDITNKFKFVPTEDNDDSTTDNGHSGSGNANQFFGVVGDNANNNVLTNPQTFSFNSNTAEKVIKTNDSVEEANGLFGNIPSIGSLPGFASQEKNNGNSPFDFGIAKNVNQIEQQTPPKKEGSIVSKFLTDIPSLQPSSDTNDDVAKDRQNIPGSNVFGPKPENFNVAMNDSSRGFALGVSQKANLMGAVGQFRDLVKLIETQGFSINIEELDMMNEYQILVKINK